MHLSWIRISIFSWQTIRSKTFLDHVQYPTQHWLLWVTAYNWVAYYLLFYCIIIYLETGRSGCGTASRTIGGRQPSSAALLSPQPSCQTSVPCLHPHHLSGRDSPAIKFPFCIVLVLLQIIWGSKTDLHIVASDPDPSLLEILFVLQCFWTLTIYYGSGSDFWKVTVPVPALVLVFI
jgi:hypothetical protein